MSFVSNTYPGKQPIHQPVKRERVKLWENMKEREKFDSMADLYSIILTTEHLEKAYVRDAILPEPYHQACSKLITQFKTLAPMLKDLVPDVEQFMKDYKLDCPAAKNRLLKIGVPATVEHGNTSNKGQKLIAETAQHFITAMNAIQLQQKSVDQLQPWLASLNQSLAECPVKDFPGKGKIKNWLITLNGMKASDELGDDQLRQLAFELEQAYNDFHKNL
jgi:ESCRT-I complex subunit VPS28